MMSGAAAAVRRLAQQFQAVVLAQVVVDQVEVVPPRERLRPAS